MSRDPVVESVLAELAAAVGPGHAEPGDSSTADYSHDESLTARPVAPAIVVRPGSTAEVSEVLRVAAAHRMPVTARGTGTGLSGGSIPVEGGSSSRSSGWRRSSRSTPTTTWPWSSRG